MVVDSFWVKKGHFDWLRAFWLVEGRVCKEKKGKVWACDSSPPKIGTICRLECEGDKVGGCFCYCLVLLPFLYIWFCRRSVYILLCRSWRGKVWECVRPLAGLPLPRNLGTVTIVYPKRDFQTLKKVFMNFTLFTIYISLPLLCQANSPMCPKSLSQPKRQADQPWRMVTYSILIFGFS